VLPPENLALFRLEATLMQACMDARRTASILASFYSALRDDDVDEPALTQLTLIYARTVLGQKL
jgi:hypothetical protein